MLIGGPRDLLASAAADQLLQLVTRDSSIFEGHQSMVGISGRYSHYSLTYYVCIHIVYITATNQQHGLATAHLKFSIPTNQRWESAAKHSCNVSHQPTVSVGGSRVLIRPTNQEHESAAQKS